MPDQPPRVDLNGNWDDETWVNAMADLLLGLPLPCEICDESSAVTVAGEPPLHVCSDCAARLLKGGKPK